MGLDAFLFDDAAMRDFIVNGYCVLKADLPPSFHEAEDPSAFVQRQLADALTDESTF